MSISIRRCRLLLAKTPADVVSLRNQFIKHLSCTPDLTISYLTNSCFLSPQSALLASQKVQLKTSKKPDSVLQLLRSYGFTDAHISRIIEKEPRLLTCDARKNLKPKMEFFHEFGFSGTNLVKLLTLAPLLLRRSLKDHLIPGLDYLQSVFQSKESVVAVFSQAPHALHSNLKKTILPCLQALREHKLPEPRISRLLALQPGVLLQGPDRVNEIVEEVKATGIQMSDGMFIYAFGTISGLKKSTWERKMAVYRSFGWSDEEVLSAFRKTPMCMRISEGKIGEVLDFFINKLKIRPSYVIRFPQLLLPSLKKTTIPRCTVLSILNREGKVGEDLSIAAALTLPARTFLQRYVTRFQDDLPDVLKAYNSEIELEGFGKDPLGQMRHPSLN
ncbi:uncharacterized protein [Typha angustifolia]|uniref:uncharacterized protein n=1 Tax=Typha angustifolia TaxID=59011 RepID=UPI003C2E840A